HGARGRRGRAGAGPATAGDQPAARRRGRRRGARRARGDWEELMELDLGPEAAAFRAEVRDWIARNAPAGLAELVDWTSPPMTGGDRAAWQRAEADPRYAEWDRRLLEGGWICPQWPDRFGG